MKKRALVVVALALGALGAWAWFGASGSGEYKASPDGRFRASATNMERGTWSLHRESFTALTVEDVAHERSVWTIELRGSEIVSPSYGRRDRHFITWSSDSSSVTFDLEGTRLVVPMRRDTPE